MSVKSEVGKVTRVAIPRSGAKRKPMQKTPKPYQERIARSMGGAPAVNKKGRSNSHRAWTN